jgi:hypothetical protein
MTEIPTAAITFSDPDPDPCDYLLTYVYGPESWLRRLPGMAGTIIIAMVPTDRRGVRWEIAIHRDDDTGPEPSVRLEMYAEEFRAYAEVPELFAALAAEAPRTLEAVRLMLDRLGVVDDTPRVGPHGETDIGAAGRSPYQALKAAVQRVRARGHRSPAQAPDQRESGHVARLADSASDTYDVLTEIRDDVRAIRDALERD